MTTLKARQHDGQSSPKRHTHAEALGLLCPGRNCWATKIADRASVLIDGAAYFRALEADFEKAERSIFIIGWDFDGNIRLRPDDAENPVVLGPFLRSLVERRPDLHVRILVWSLSILHAPGASAPLILGSEWQDHPRVTLKLDTEHPVYAAHHQKIVCIDDRVSFVGGMDLTVARWDSMQHRSHDERRCDYDGAPYGPVHDVQMRVEGEAAACVADIARHRWRVATGEALEPCMSVAGQHEPHGACDFTRTPVAIALTAPAWKGERPHRETAMLTRDLLLSAKRFAYIEAQYLTARYVSELLEDLLQRLDGPEIVVLLRHDAEGFFERRYMAENGNRLLRRLKRHDRYSRLRCFSPVVRENGETRHILVHSKVMIIDDEALRIGSSNLNNRSVGLDTECDLAIEAQDTASREAIARVREQLLAEHLGTEPETIAAEFARSGSLIEVIDRLNGGTRSLAPFAALHTPGPTRPVWGSAIIDPERPIRILRPLMRPLTRIMRPKTRRA